VPLAADFAAFFAGCEDGVVPPAGIFVTCDPTDGSDTADAAAAATCVRMKADLGSLAPSSVGQALGVQNGNFDPAPSAITAEGAGGRLLRCTFGAAARIDVAAAPVDIELAGTVPPPAGAKVCFGHLTPTVDVACRTAGGEAFELVLSAPSAMVAKVLATLEADPA
jgi:hypothetical protein